MKSKFLSCLMLTLLALLLLGAEAEAKRMGGGASFGSKPSYSKSYSAPTSPSSPSSSPIVQPRTTPTPAPVAAPQPSTGFGSRFGWGIGGFLAGGLLGSMLFGHGFGGGMGGGGIGMLDIILIGLIIFFVVKLFRGRKQSGPQEASPPEQFTPPPADGRSQAQQSWDALRSTPSSPPPAAEQPGTGGFGDGSQTPGQPVAQAAEPVVPEGFSIPDFLEGAKSVYSRLQTSWDRRDLKDIALFTTAEVLAEIERQAVADPNPSKTELLMVNARLLEFKEDSQLTVATVYFDVLLREDASESHPKQVREVWHFMRETANPNSNWKLEGIQQMEG